MPGKLVPEPTEIPMSHDPKPQGSRNQASAGRGRQVAVTIALVALLLVGAALEALGGVVGFFEISWTQRASATAMIMGPGWALVMTALALTFRRHDRQASEDRGAVTWPVVIASGLLLVPLLLATGGMCGVHLMTIIDHPTDVTRYYPHIWSELSAWGVILGAQLISAAMTIQLARRHIRSDRESP